jgi:biopolymer transport protein ExbD
MAKRSLRSEDEPTEINLAPMIDCVFILLIFFIVTTVFVQEKGMQVHKPDAAASAPAAEDQTVAFEITAENKVLFEGHEVSLAEVTGRVRGVASSSDIPVVIRAHEKAHHGTFVSVWDAAKRGGSHTLSFSTVN